MSDRASHQPVPLTGQPSSKSSPAGTVLDTLADRLMDTGYDGVSGREYVHLREWASATSVMAVFDEQVWVGDDGSGRDVRQRYPDQPLGAVPRAAGGGSVLTDSQDFPVAGFPRSLPAPPSSDPSVLAGQLDQISPRANGPQSVVRAIADLYRDTAPRRAVRTMILRLLAETPGLALRGQVVDRAGRPGIAVSIDSDTRDTLIIAAGTGVVLAFEAIELVKAPGSALPVGDVRDSVVFLGLGRVDRVGVVSRLTALESLPSQRSLAPPAGAVTVALRAGPLAANWCRGWAR